MKWFFGVSAATFDHRDHDWINMIKAAVCSARQNTWLQPNLIFHGPDSLFTQQMRELGVNVIHHESSLYDAMAAQPAPFPLMISAGAYLRIDIPWLEPDDEYALYTDCDVLFRRHPDIMHLRPAYFAVAPQMVRGQHDDMNSGVMLINVRAMRREMPGFSRFIVENMSRFGTLSHDQSALQEYFAGRYEPLPDELNWKPYWGLNPDAQIVHFHGPKPGAVKTILADPSYETNPVWRGLLDANVPAYRHYVTEWDGYRDRAQAYLGGIGLP